MARPDKDTLVDLLTATTDAARDLETGSFVGNYVIDSFVAKGGFATVFRGRSRLTGEVVAIKVLRPEMMKSAVTLARFRREAEMLERLTHPAIVKVHSIDELADGTPYLVMEWIAGHTLSDEIRRRGTFSPDELLGVLEPLCGALSAAHALGIVHRDLKPSNVMVIPDGDWFRIKLVDFGIAKLLEPETESDYTSLTATGTFLGSPSYMAPEQFIGLRVDARTDVYALAIVSHLLLAGKLPFRAATPFELVEMHQTAKPPAISSISRAPASLDPVFDRALAKMPSKRHESVGAFIEDVRRALQSPAKTDKAVSKHWLFIHIAANLKQHHEELDEAAMAQVDEALVTAEDTLEKAGMQVVSEGGQAILGYREGNLKDTESFLRDALTLHAKLAQGFSNVHVAITVHKAAESGAAKALRWTVKSPWDAVSATHEVVNGLERRFESRSIDGIANKVRIIRYVEAP